jgi:hypothetical protein
LVVAIQFISVGRQLVIFRFSEIKCIFIADYECFRENTCSFLFWDGVIICTCGPFSADGTISAVFL